MATLAHQIDDEFGSYMGARLYFDFNILEAVTRYLKDHQRSYGKTQVKKIFNQFIDKYVVNQLDLNENPLSSAIDDCFEAWWKGQPEPRNLEQQEKESSENLFTDEYYQIPLKRVKDYQSDQEMYRQMHEGQESLPQGFKANNTPLIDKLLSTPKEMRTVFQSTFRGVTSGQLPDKLEESGVLDTSIRNRVMKHLLSLCNNTKSVMGLTDNELPLSVLDVAHWVSDHLKGKAVYMQDSKTWYYQRDNKYMDTPDCHTGEPVNNTLEDYYNLCSDWEDDYPLFSQTISKMTDRLQEHTQNLYYLIGNVETHTEEEFNNNVLQEGRFCTVNGLYDYLEKKSSSNGLTKVTTEANICEELKTEADMVKSEGVQLFSLFMKQIQPDDEIRNFLMDVIANAITGHREGEYTYILHGPTGSNGKSVLMALLQHMLGGYYADYNTDSLVRHSYSESPEQAAKNLENRRLVGGREIGDGSTIDGGAFKRYFSNDSYTINEKYKPSYSVKPTHTMFLPVNQMPNFGSDPAVRRRLVVIPFTEHFVTNPDPRNPHEHLLDKDMLKNLIAHEDEIFTYLVWWALQIRNGRRIFTIPQVIQHYGDEIVDETNALADFVTSEARVLTEEQMNDLTIPTPLTTGKELYERYILSLTPGTYNPYKGQKSFVRALLLKYPQLTSVNGYTTDKKQQLAIRGIWLDPTTTAALKLAKSRTDDNGMQVSYPTFKANTEYQDWLLKNQQ